MDTRRRLGFPGGMLWAMRAFLAAFTLVLLTASTGAAQDDGPSDLPPVRARPTSGEASLLSGRTLGVGETMIGGGAGWPGIFATFQHALTSSFNLGARAALTYGSPLMGLEPGIGGDVGFPMRIHLFGEGDLDLAAYLEPAFAFGEGAAMGEVGNVFSGDFGWSSRLEFGGLIGFHVQERLTVLVGAGGMLGFVHVPDAGDPSVVGGATARIGIEGLISRDTMLFALAEGGVGFADDRGALALYDSGLISPILRIALGLAYLL